MTHPAGRKRGLVALTAIALLGLGLFAPAASAQIGTVTDTVDSTTGTVVDTTTKTTDTVKDTVDKTTDSTTTTTGSTTDKVIDTVDSVGSTVDSTTGTKTYDGTKDTVTTTTDSAAETLNKTAGSVGGTVEDASGGLVTNPNLDVDNPLGSTKKDGNKTSGPASRKEGSAGGRNADLAAAREARQNARNRMASLAATERNTRPGSLVAASAVLPEGDSFLSQLGEAAREALEKAAFPLGLALMVGAFLMVQGRIDRKDAKLALAPIDSEQDLLSFQ